MLRDVVSESHSFAFGSSKHDDDPVGWRLGGGDGGTRCGCGCGLGLEGIHKR